MWKNLSVMHELWFLNTNIALHSRHMNKQVSTPNLVLRRVHAIMKFMYFSSAHNEVVVQAKAFSDLANKAVIFSSCYCFFPFSSPSSLALFHCPHEGHTFSSDHLFSCVWSDLHMTIYCCSCDLSLVTRDVKAMVKLIKWFRWLGTATKQLVWLQMRLNVQQISKVVVEGKWLEPIETVKVKS